VKLAISLHDDLQGADEIDFIQHPKSLRHGICVGWSARKLSSALGPDTKFSTQKVTRHNPGEAFNLSWAKFAANVCTRKIIPIQIYCSPPSHSFRCTWRRRFLRETASTVQNLPLWYLVFYDSRFHVRRGASGYKRRLCCVGNRGSRTSGGSRDQQQPFCPIHLPRRCALQRVETRLRLLHCFFCRTINCVAYIQACGDKFRPIWRLFLKNRDFPPEIFISVAFWWFFAKIK
jgi:hypothetical protein